MRRIQKNEPFEEPPRDRIAELSRLHVQAMEGSDGDEVWVGAGMRNVLLRTVGRRSGREHTVALPYWLDEDGDRIVVASFAGAPSHPAWFHNLADSSANPEVLVREKLQAYWSVPGILDGDEYRRIWSELTGRPAVLPRLPDALRAAVPIVRLPETRPA